MEPEKEFNKNKTNNKNNNTTENNNINETLSLETSEFTSLKDKIYDFIRKSKKYQLNALLNSIDSELKTLERENPNYKRTELSDMQRKDYLKPINDYLKNKNKKINEKINPERNNNSIKLEEDSLDNSFEIGNSDISNDNNNESIINNNISKNNNKLEKSLKISSNKKEENKINSSIFNIDNNISNKDKISGNESKNENTYLFVFGNESDYNNIIFLLKNNKQYILGDNINDLSCLKENYNFLIYKVNKENLIVTLMKINEIIDLKDSFRKTGKTKNNYFSNANNIKYVLLFCTIGKTEFIENYNKEFIEITSEESHWQIFYYYNKRSRNNLYEFLKITY